MFSSSLPLKFRYLIRYFFLGLFFIFLSKFLYSKMMKESIFSTKKVHFLNFQVESDEKYERLGGSHLGGASLVGIAKLIADVKSRIFRDDILQI